MSGQRYAQNFRMKQFVKLLKHVLVQMSAPGRKRIFNDKHEEAELLNKSSASHCLESVWLN